VANIAQFDAGPRPEDRCACLQNLSHERSGSRKTQGYFAFDRPVDERGLYPETGDRAMPCEQFQQLLIFSGN
jgi:hypothetical protein